VEVGGGLGLSCLPVAQAFPQLRFEIQDRQEVVSRAKTVRRLDVRQYDAHPMIRSGRPLPQI
jgi:hypothetical protein